MLNLDVFHKVAILCGKKVIGKAPVHIDKCNRMRRACKHVAIRRTLSVNHLHMAPYEASRELLSVRSIRGAVVHLSHANAFQRYEMIYIIPSLSQPAFMAQHKCISQKELSLSSSTPHLSKIFKCSKLIFLYVRQWANMHEFIFCCWAYL